MQRDCDIGPIVENCDCFCNVGVPTLKKNIYIQKLKMKNRNTYTYTYNKILYFYEIY